ncbi:uncharacterized protein A4U43_C07F17840 [Asparagus officinalis]|uniref:Uncharacterized protein n=1 Tax=Asparagus officinalis TaxID=4686 RepID=A0A5P1ECS5_ASPOF|nr:uncharacterized protein A4U43_C07F17840 [Asparagus officinalis]
MERGTKEDDEHEEEEIVKQRGGEKEVVTADANLTHHHISRLSRTPIQVTVDPRRRRHLLNAAQPPTSTPPAVPHPTTLNSEKVHQPRPSLSSSSIQPPRLPPPPSPSSIIQSTSSPRRRRLTKLLPPLLQEGEARPSNSLARLRSGASAVLSNHRSPSLATAKPSINAGRPPRPSTSQLWSNLRLHDVSRHASSSCFAIPPPAGLGVAPCLSSHSGCLLYFFSCLGSH